MNGQNIIMVCQQNWDIGTGTNAKNLAKEFAKKNRVLYVNLPLDVNTLLRAHKEPGVKIRIRMLLGQEESLVKAQPNIWVYSPDVLGLSTNWLSSQSIFSLLNNLNAWMLARSIRKVAQVVGFDSYYLLQDGLIFPGLELKRLLKPRKFIYYLRDYMIAVPYFRRHGPWLEAALLKQADVVAANSAYLADYARQHNPHSYDIGQGCVLTLYQAHTQYPLPTELTWLPKPLIGYTGYLTTARLDLELLLAIARRQPSWSLVLVGPEDEAFAQSPLHDLPNVFFPGSKVPSELPAFLSHFDVCINPQVVNEITVGNYPLKIDEYLAMGRPVVATHTRTMELFQDYVYLASSEDEWIELLAKALVDQDPNLVEARVRFAHNHTWEASVGQLYRALNEVEHQSSNVI